MTSIAISSTLEKGKISINADYSEALYLFGALPSVLIPTSDGRAICEMASLFDGLLLAGGGDIYPDIYGEDMKCGTGYFCRERDEFEILLFKSFYTLGKPILGICRGQQIINVALGGTLFQDIPGHSEVRHKIFLSGNLAKLIERESIDTNSFHHQAIKRLGTSLSVSAVSDDGTIEAIEGTGDNYLRGVQFHPEKTFKYDIFSKKIIKDFVRSVSETRLSRE